MAVFFKHRIISWSPQVTLTVLILVPVLRHETNVKLKHQRSAKEVPQYNPSLCHSFPHAK